jgi:hypothetical protein
MNDCLGCACNFNLFNDILHYSQPQLIFRESIFSSQVKECQTYLLQVYDLIRYNFSIFIGESESMER